MAAAVRTLRAPPASISVDDDPLGTDEGQRTARRIDLHGKGDHLKHHNPREQDDAGIEEPHRLEEEADHQERPRELRADGGDRHNGGAPLQGE